MKIETLIKRIEKNIAEKGFYKGEVQSDDKIAQLVAHGYVVEKVMGSCGGRKLGWKVPIATFMIVKK
jgi:hypothetical protein